MESEPMITPREKSLLQEEFSPEEDQTHDAAWTEPGICHGNEVLVEMKIENRGKKIFRGKTNRQAYFFFKQPVAVGESMKITTLVASKIGRGLWWSYRSWTFAYFKLFPWRKYTASPDWSEKFGKPMNIDIAFEAQQELAIMAGL